MAQHLLIQAEHHCLKATNTSHNLQHYRLVQPKHRQAKPAQTAWRDVLVARCQAPNKPIVSRYVTWRNTPCRQAPRGAGTSHAALIA
ncbi:hypothetical protein DEO72_LG4g526 [Vigna unguiculata]|uniref:Uncharacterized protein n=1 Tax=Vigna unguiculata TaxID=3917 RepID=A0A4D6LM15_VIGUN|nr:hypothetical protein DEO72_LG4g526 [Vigna unguiculata]